MPELLSFVPTLPLAFIGGIVNTVVVIVGIGLLIFVHEAGHFLVAKWNKVRVEAFSLGFGPVIWGFRRGDTHYRLSAIPLGGYVKMAGETPGDEHTDDPAELMNKGVLARAAIFSAGVIMNAIIAVILFIVAFRVGVPLPTTVIGSVTPGSPAWKAGIEAGDRIVSIDGTRVLSFQDVMEAVAFSEEPLHIELERNGEKKVIDGVAAKRDAALGVRVLGVEPAHERKIGVEEDTPAWNAGLRPGDEVVSVNGVDWSDSYGLNRVLAESDTVRFVVRREGETLTFDVKPTLAPVENGRAIIGVMAVVDQVNAVEPGLGPAKAGLEDGDRIVAVNGKAVASVPAAETAAKAAAPAPVTFTVKRGEKEVVVGPVSDLRSAEDWSNWFDGLYSGPSDANSNRVSLTPDRSFDGESPARKAGLPEGAVITSVNGDEVESFKDIQDAIGNADAGQAIRVSWTPPGGGDVVGPVSIVPRVPLQPVYGFTWPAVATREVRLTNIVDAAAAGLRQSLLTGRRILQMLGGLVTGKVSAKNLGGPVFIFQVSYATAQRNFLHFLYFLGMLSVNLAILNVLPIPVLDGGHLMFVLIEAIRRKPLSERTMAAFQWAGFLFLILLMAFVIVQDVGRLLG